MVDSNLQRTEILPSEKAFSYKIRLEALRRLPGRSKDNPSPVGTNIGLRSNQLVSNEVGDSKTQVARYIRLTELISELRELVDEHKMALRPAVELSYLMPEEQKMVYDETILRDCMPSHAQAIRMRKLSAHSMLTDSAIDDIMKEEKPNQKEKIHIPYSEIRMFLPKGMTVDRANDYIKRALEYYQKRNGK